MEVKTFIGKTLSVVCARRDNLDSKPLGRPKGVSRVTRQLDRDFFWLSSARRAVELGHELASSNSNVSIGIATGDIESEEDAVRLLNEASGSANLTEPGQILVSLSTQEITRTLIPDNLTFVRLGHRELDTGIKSLLFFLTERDQVRENAVVLPERSVRMRGDFVGRANDLERIREMIGLTGVVSIYGEAGIGKSALAMRFSREFECEDDARSIWVEMDEIPRPSLMLHRIASALEIEYLHESTLAKQIAKKIGTQNMLLVLDGADRVLEAASDFIDYIVAVCPSLCIVTTSRLKLPTGAYSNHLLNGLDRPSPFERAELAVQYDAISLLLQVIQRSQAEFILNESTIRDLMQIAEAVEGSPLAIHMIASRAEMLSLKQIRSRLTDDPLAFLVDKSLAVGSIHSALSAALSTLNPWSQLLFKRLWIFEGEFNADSIESVCADSELPKAAVLDSLKDLWESHLVIRCQPAGSKRSFRMSRLCREYSKSFASEEERKTLKTRILKYLKDQETKFWPSALGSDAEALEEFERCYEDLRACWLAGLSTKNGVKNVVESVVKAANFWPQRLQYEEGLYVLTRVTQNRYAEDTPKYLSLVNATAYYSSRMGDYKGASAVARIGLRAAIKGGDPFDMVRLLTTASSLFSDLNRPRSAVRCSRMALKVLGESNQTYKSIIETNLAGQLVPIGKVAEAEELIARQEPVGHGNDWSAVNKASNTAHVRATQGKFKAARSALKQVVDLMHRFPYPGLLPSIYLVACKIAEGERRFSALNDLTAAVRVIEEHYCFPLVPRQQKLVDHFNRLSDEYLPGALGTYSTDRPLLLLEQFLIST